MKDVRVFFRISQSEKEALDRISNYLSVTPSSLFRIMLADYNRKFPVVINERSSVLLDCTGDFED